MQDLRRLVICLHCRPNNIFLGGMVPTGSFGLLIGSLSNDDADAEDDA